MRSVLRRYGTPTLCRWAVAASLGAVDDGASSLWRWQLYDVGGWDLPWHELAPLAREIAAFPVTPLPAACAAVALAAIGDDEALGELVSSATKLAEAGLLVPAPLIAAVAEAARASFAGSWGHVADTLMPFAISSRPSAAVGPSVRSLATPSSTRWSGRIAAPRRCRCWRIASSADLRYASVSCWPAWGDGRQPMVAGRRSPRGGLRPAFRPARSERAGHPR